jgi:hypothetical protein
MLVPFKPIPGGVREKLLKIDYAGSGLTIVSSILILVSKLYRITFSSLLTQVYNQLGLNWYL